jgi:hypothetical protein
VSDISRKFSSGGKINKAFEGGEIHLKKYYHKGKPVGPFVMVAFEEDALL